MGLFFVDRSSRKAGPYLAWKVRLFVAGAVAAVLGMAREWSWLLGVAVLLLGAGFLLRFLPGEEAEASEPEASEPDEEDAPEHR